MSNTYDAIVVGARVAGAPTAMLLARRGYRVLLIDRDTFPSDTMSTFMLHLPGVALLKRWGLLDRLQETGVPGFSSYTIDAGPVTVSAPTGTFEGVDRWYAPRRKVLDKLLLDAAAEAGVEVRTGVTFTRLLKAEGRVVGIAGHDADGNEVTEFAELVIGADGMRSRVARDVGAGEYNVKPTLAATYYSIFEDFDHTEPSLFIRERRVFGVWSTNDRQLLAFAMVPADEFRTFKRDAEANFMGVFREHAPDLYERLAAAPRTERLVGTGDMPNFFRQPWGPGWALVGDAGYHKDPTLGHGIMDAFLQADLLAGHVHRGLAGEVPMDEALEDYRQARDARHMADYELVTEMADLAHPPDAQLEALIDALSRDRQGAAEFIGILTATYPIEKFMDPQNIAAIMERVSLPAAA